jgi:CDP-glucose 4,6-dehydratase
MAVIEKENIWRDRSVLVTGGAGFIGSWLAYALLQRGARVIILDKKEGIPRLGELGEKLKSEAIYFSGDVRDGALFSQLFEKHNVKTVFHLAAEALVGRAHENPTEALDTNVRGTWTVLEACRQKNPQAEIIIASSDKAYGTHAELPYREDFPLLGENPYDCSKSAADRIATMYAKIYGLHLAITRCGNVYGGGDLNFSRLIPDTIRALFLKIPPEIRSDGLFRRDYIHVSDIVAAYIRTAEAIMNKEIDPGDAFNFGTATPRTAIEVVQNISALMGVSIEPVILATAHYEIRDQYLDSEKAYRILGWRARRSFEEGMEETIDWYRKFFKISS